MKKFLAALFIVFAPAAAFAQSDIFNCCGMTSRLNITTATVVKAGPGKLVAITVNTAGSAAGTASDTTTTGAVAAGNLLFSIPNTAGVYYVPMPFLNGLVITPGTSQVLSVSYQ